MAATTTVSSAAELKSALSSASGGDTIVLKSGDYGDVTLSNHKFGANVTIVSETGKGAVFDTLRLSDSSNITFRNITVDYRADPGDSESTQAFRIENSSGISVRTSVFEGSPDSGGYGRGVGLFVTDSDDIAVTGNEFSDFLRGALVRVSQDVVVRNNDFHTIRSDGLNLSQVDKVLVEANSFRDFVMKPGSGDHPDMIQVHTGGTDVPTQNLTIRGNFMSSDDYRLHGIWMANELVSANPSRTDMYYRNILIEDNVIFAAHPHGIAIGHANGLTIRDNTVLHSIVGVDDYWGPPQIDVNSASRNVSVSDNISEVYKLSPDPAVAGTWSTGNNLTVQNEDPSGANHYSELFLNALTVRPEPADLRALPGSLVETMGVGSSMTRFDPTPETLTAQVVGSAEAPDVFFFDASLSAAASGLLGEADALFEWDFGNGFSATGRTVVKSFDEPGLYEVTLKVTAGGESDTSTIWVRVLDPLLLQVDGEGGVADSSVYGVPVTAGESSVTLVAGRDGQGMRFDDRDRVTFDKDLAEQLYNLDGFEVSFDLKLDGGAASAGRIVTLHESWLLEVEDDGEITFDFTNAAGQSFSLTSSGAGLTDGSWHGVRVTYDSDAGEARIRVDGKLVGSTPMSGVTKPLEYWDPSLGYHWTDGFDGILDNFEITTDNPPIRLADIAPIEGVASNPVLVGGDKDDEVFGSVRDDRIDAGNGNNRISADRGDDVVVAGNGDDRLDGGKGDDSINAGGGDDTVIGGGGNDILNGGGGTDRMAGWDGHDVVNGWGGNDRILGGAGNDTLRGGAGDDVVIGHAGADSIEGGDGDDKLRGWNGDDRIAGGAGADLLRGGAGDDVLLGGAGADKLIGFRDDDKLRGGTGADHLNGWTGDDILFGEGGHDVLLGAGGNDSLYGGDGDDILNGGPGADLIVGGAGADVLRGWGGPDTLDGGRGDDLYSLGDGAKTIVIGPRDGADTVIGFDPALARIDLSATPLNGFGDLSIAATSDGVTVDYGSGSLVLRGLSVSDLTADEFIFG